MNWNDPDERPDVGLKYKAGDVVRVSVTAAEQRTAKSGCEYFNLKLSDADGYTVCFDVVMLETLVDGEPVGGSMGGNAKLRGLGFGEANEEILADECVGSSVWVKLKAEVWEGRKRLKVDLFYWSQDEEEHWRAGYWRDAPDIPPPPGAHLHAESPPADSELGPYDVPAAADDVPF